jgi:hypothetical protein
MTETERDTYRHYRRQGAVSPVLVAHLSDRRGMDVGPQRLRRAGWADARPAAVGRGAAGRLGAARTPRFQVAGQRLATASATPTLSRVRTEDEQLRCYLLGLRFYLVGHPRRPDRFAAGASGPRPCSVSLTTAGRPARPGTGDLGPARHLPAAAHGHDRRRHPPGHQPGPGQLHHRPAGRHRPADRRRHPLNRLALGWARAV